jgi:hypothetical protein
MATTSAEPAGKTCTECLEELSLTAFLPSSLSADGYSGKCRSCIWSAAQRDRSAREMRNKLAS